MKKWWLIAIITVIVFSIVSPAKAIEGGKIQEKRYPVSTPLLTIYKSNEEIAWELLKYAITNIPSLKFRINQYEDLLEAYRKALNVVKEPKERIPPYQER